MKEVLMINELTEASSKQKIAIEEFLQKTPQLHRPLFERLFSTVSGLEFIYKEIFPHKPVEAFTVEIFGTLWDAQATGEDIDKHTPAIAKAIDTKEVDIKALEDSGVLLGLMLISCAYCVQALKAVGTDSHGIAWAYIADARYWYGTLSGIRRERLEHISGQKTYASNMGKEGAAARHAPTKKVKSWVIQRYLEGHYPSANKAAHVLTNDALKFARTIDAALSEENAQRTIAKWIRESKKESV
jgi:hypothetical protein